MSAILRMDQYHASSQEKLRTADLMDLLPRNRNSVLDVGARDGFFSGRLTEYFASVTALDLEQPTFDIPRVKTVAGNATALEYPDNSFDVVFCAEVLEHIPDVAKACSELLRVAKYEVLIGVPYRQDTRVGRATCSKCGRVNPPYGHVNTFDEKRLAELFPGAPVVRQTLVGETAEATNFASAWLMDLSRNPWGDYEQDEPCIYCGQRLVAPKSRTVFERACSYIAGRINTAQQPFVRPHGNWIHTLFTKSA